MLEALEKLCMLRDVPHQLSWEAHMRCGIGLCGSCELQVRSGAGWLTCLDGPVHHSRSGAP
jgi:dihydroorotate dehydrogenase electron transfer subunit